MSERRIASLDSKRHEPDPELVEELEALLEMAKTGELRGIVFCRRRFGEFEGRMQHVYQAVCKGEMEKGDTLVALEYLKYDIVFPEFRR